MQTVERFFHLRNPFLYSHGGATVRVVGIVGSNQVEVQHTICSPKDAFCKKTGRETAASRAVKVIPLVHLPRELSDIAKKANQINRGKLIAIAHRPYDFAMKYFMPKELA